MEICRRDPEAIITEKLTEELTNQINQHVIDAIKSKFPYYYLEPDKYKKYEDKFEIRIVGDNVMPYRVQHFIHTCEWTKCEFFFSINHLHNTSD